jgi:regulator of sigma E protease
VQATYTDVKHSLANIVTPYTILIFVTLLLLIITCHEWGHYWVAKKCGVRCLCFSIGFGPALWSYQTASGTRFRIALVPLGGYVRLLDEDQAPVDPAFRHAAFNTQSIAARAAIVAAGPAVNAVLAIACFAGMYLLGYDAQRPFIGAVIPHSIASKANVQSKQIITQINHQVTPTWRHVLMTLMPLIGTSSAMTLKTETHEYTLQLKNWQLDRSNPNPIEALGLLSKGSAIPIIITAVKPNSPAAKANIQPGDQITEINGQPVQYWGQAIKKIQKSAHQPLTISLKRPGQKPRQASLQPKRSHWLATPQIGIQVALPQHKPRQHIVHLSGTWLSCWPMALKDCWQFTRFYLTSLQKLVTGELSLFALGGPITIYQATDVAAQQGFAILLGFAGMLNVMLAVMNLLPIPGLDGGHLMWLGLESCRRKPLSQHVRLAWTRVGVGVLLCLMVLATTNDLMRLL